MTQEEYKVQFQLELDHIMRMKELGNRGVYVDWFVEKKITESYDRIKELNELVAS